MKKSGEVVVSPLRSIFLIFLIKHGFIAISAEQDVRHPFRGSAHLLTDDFLVNVGGAFKPKAAESAEKVPFLVKISISDLNIRKGPGTDYDRVQFCPVGVYTIVEVKSGKGASAVWGRLKSGIGWISLDFVKKVKLNNESLLSLQVLGEILVFAGFFAFSEKKLDKLTIHSYNMANFR